MRLVANKEANGRFHSDWLSMMYPRIKLARNLLITMSHKPMNVGAILVGGALFGAGWAIMGYCPGTSVGALGEGRWHAIFAIAGMVTGAGVYAELYPFFKTTVLFWADFGKIGLPEALGVSPWIVIAVFILMVLALFRWFESKGL